MKKLLRQAEDIARRLTIRDGANRTAWALGVVGAALLTSSATAVAAPAPPIGGTTIKTLPADLAVTMAAPATVPSYAASSSLTVNVTNTPPTLYKIGAGTLVRAHIDLTGLVASSAVSDAGWPCTVSTANADTPWSVVDCIGTLAYGASTIITVQFQSAAAFTPPGNSCNHGWYCGEPAYADASVTNWSGSAELTLANNRALSRVDTDSCIN
jgi:hypothetical protein